MVLRDHDKPRLGAACNRDLSSGVTSCRPAKSNLEHALDQVAAPNVRHRPEQVSAQDRNGWPTSSDTQHVAALCSALGLVECHAMSLGWDGMGSRTPKSPQTDGRCRKTALADGRNRLDLRCGAAHQRPAFVG